MNNNLRTAAAAVALVTGLVTAGGTASAAAAPRPERITSQEQLAASIAQAVATAEEKGDTGGVIVVGMISEVTASTRALSC
ncbi:hypothetical protein OG349_02990 [Streptomyces sp. NBC_01317]|uniref:hypothetical protein n=1 Tax=Streptomyces sp. NBC_01317 TaxID=2903822 RepID=UPI002E13D5DD|nr:hypothetical protein OG349_02990 [Streptomyces sp. NBC_01317]